jgi:hypothetical protein
MAFGKTTLEKHQDMNSRLDLTKKENLYNVSLCFVAFLLFFMFQCSYVDTICFLVLNFKDEDKQSSQNNIIIKNIFKMNGKKNIIK